MNYTIIAGVNGSGKSTIYNTGTLEKSKLGIRINTDEIVANKYGNKWEDNNIQFKAGKEAMQLLKECLKNNHSFNQESTLTGKSIISTIKKAKEQGYKISLCYIGLESVDLSIERVTTRVDKGGHGISEDILKRRYPKSLENLKIILPLCDNIYVYDNSNSLRDILRIENNKVTIIEKEMPQYLSDILEPYINNLKENNIMKSEKTINSSMGSINKKESIKDKIENAKTRANEINKLKEENKSKSDIDKNSR